MAEQQESAPPSVTEETTEIPVAIEEVAASTAAEEVPPPAEEAVAVEVVAEVAAVADEKVVEVPAVVEVEAPAAEPVPEEKPAEPVVEEIVVVEVPAPVEPIVEAPAPVEEVVEAPAPVEEVVEAPAPVEEVVEVPAPVEAVVEAPAPVEVIVVESPAPAVTLVEAVQAAATPLKYADLGREVNDLISKDFQNMKKLKLTTTSAATGFQSTTEGGLHSHSGDVLASQDLKYTGKGWSLSSKLDTGSLVSTTFTAPLMKGLSIDLNSTYSLVDGTNSMKLKTSFARCGLLHSTLDVDLSASPIVDFTCAVAHSGFYAGYQTSLESTAKKFIGHNVSAGYKNDKFIFHGAVENASKLIGSVCYRVQKGLTAGAHVAYTRGGSTPTVTLAGEYDVDAYTSVKVKADTNKLLGFSYTTQIRPSIGLTVSCMSGGGNKFGVSLDFQA